MFAFGFAKNDTGNIDEKDEARLKTAAELTLGLSDLEITKLGEAGKLAEVKRDDRSKSMKAYESEVAGAVHEMVEGFHEVGVVDKQTMRQFDELCLTPATPLNAEQIRALREREHVSQSVFARHLNVSKNLVSDWERRLKRPGGPALRLLTIVQKRGLSAIT